MPQRKKVSENRHVATKENDDITSLAEEIVRYLENHPNAADTVNGITNWWITRQRYEESAARVRLALEFLEKEKKITKRELPGKEIVYLKTMPDVPKPDK